VGGVPDIDFTPVTRGKSHIWNTSALCIPALATGRRYVGRADAVAYHP
jgi:hypothetical protein